MLSQKEKLKNIFGHFFHFYFSIICFVHFISIVGLYSILIHCCCGNILTGNCLNKEYFLQYNYSRRNFLQTNVTI